MILVPRFISAMGEDENLADSYLEKAQKAEEAGLKSTNPDLREGWLEVARSYRLLASRNLKHALQKDTKPAR